MSKKEKFKFKIENENHEWDDQFITGAQVRAIPPGIPINMDLFIKRSSKPGELVGNDDKIDLGEPGIEKFYSQVADSSPGA
ncbi:MAG TPA: multiubiquitin domain-containing protein [Flavobacterium sp.]|nr:multiubiquitin domain-containing protein [Flavobacterium sp.]